MKNTHAADRRTTYRHHCNSVCQVGLNAVMRDLSLGGAAVELPFCVPPGERILLRIYDNDPKLRNVPAEVLSTSSGRVHSYCMHVRFFKLQPDVEKALQRYLLALQANRVA